MRLSTRLASAKLAFFFWSSATCRTGDGEYLLGARVFRHAERDSASTSVHRNGQF
jgi:hypothetical protein